jgi:hypothetical protein
MPSCAIGMLQLRRSAVAMETSGSGPHAPSPAFVMTVLVPGSVKVDGLGRRESGVYWPDSRAAATVMSLNVDPGGLRLLTARSTSGFAGSARSDA